MGRSIQQRVVQEHHQYWRYIGRIEPNHGRIQHQECVVSLVVDERVQTPPYSNGQIALHVAIRYIQHILQYLLGSVITAPGVCLNSINALIIASRT